MAEILEPKVSLHDLERVLNRMLFYNRNDGYLAFIGEKLEFFDGEPQGGCYVTKKDIENYILKY